MSSLNYGSTTEYSLSIDDDRFYDQIVISDDKLIIKNGDNDELESVWITIRARSISADGQVEGSTLTAKQRFPINLNNNSAELWFGTDADEVRPALWQDSITYTSKGRDKLDGGEGKDKLIILDNNSKIIKLYDKTGEYTGISDQKFLFIGTNELENGDYQDVTYAWNYDEIELNGKTYTYYDLPDNGSWEISYSPIEDQSIKDNDTIVINLDEYIFSPNDGSKVTYSVIDVRNSKINDQVSIIDSKLSIISGSEGSSQMTQIIIRASQSNGIDGPIDEIHKNKDIILNVTLKDNGQSSIVNAETKTLLSELSAKYLSSDKDISITELIPNNNNVLNGTINYSKGNDIIVITGGGNTERGLDGNDTYIVSNLIPINSKINIIDTSGLNTIQIPDGTFINQTLFTKNAVRLTLEDSRVITINGANKFEYNIGANITSGDSSDNLKFSEFALIFGLDDILNSSGTLDGLLSDVYVI